VRKGAAAVAVAVVLVCALIAPAAADPPSEDISEYTFHEHQIGVSARFGVGYRALFTNQKLFCGQTDINGNTDPCTGRAPYALDLEASYAVKRSIELLVEFHVGLERDFGSSPTDNAGPYPFHIAPGARFFFSEAKHAKLFVQPMMVFDLTGYKASSFDFGLRGLEGIWIDLHKTYGFYFYLGETAQFLKWAGGSRWLDVEFEAGVGFQGRYP
jgi:hypothetical protein